ncbi:MAG: ABC transporter permease [Planctomycetota bacterium]
MSDPSEFQTHIRPHRPGLLPDVAELWRYRDLLLLLVWRDISTKYRQSFLGVAWAVFRPIFSALIFTLVFSVFLKQKTAIPYPLYAFAGLIPWMYFSTSLGNITNSVQQSANVLTKVYFPRMILPIAAICTPMVEVFIQLIITAVLIVVYQQPITPGLLLLPLFVLLAGITAFAFGIWLTALNVRYRDVGVSVPFILQMLMYLCPIMYKIDVVPEHLRWIYSLNPMVGIIEGFRWALFGLEQPHWQSMFISMGVVSVMLVSGLVFFRRVENTFADII